jgi:hypothetical protein
MDNVYFAQIAEMLLSTKAFISNINRVREIYLEKQTSSQNDFDFYKKPGVSKKTIYSEIAEIAKRYKLSKRWEPWLEKILYYDFYKNKKIIYRYIPTGKIIRNKRKIIEDGRVKFIDEPVIVGDETESELRDFQDTYNININLNNPSRRRKPIQEFEKQLRWYKMREDNISYIDIFDSELDSHLKDWREFKEYKEHRNDNTTSLPSGRTKAEVERMAINRLKSGVNKLRERISKELK